MEIRWAYRDIALRDLCRLEDDDDKATALAVAVEGRKQTHA
ncbi:MAG: hypothetical protein K0R52_862 [Alphaproteobacteria bacterium]|jgi:hypothetical protein|nr:hypothetical protein [Alphaproteobacteria bacterium]